jgi:hypothetical protein
MATIERERPDDLDELLYRAGKRLSRGSLASRVAVAHLPKTA